MYLLWIICSPFFSLQAWDINPWFLRRIATNWKVSSLTTLQPQFLTDRTISTIRRSILIDSRTLYSVRKSSFQGRFEPESDLSHIGMSSSCFTFLCRLCPVFSSSLSFLRSTLFGWRWLDPVISQILVILHVAVRVTNPLFLRYITLVIPKLPYYLK